MKANLYRQYLVNKLKELRQLQELVDRHYDGDGVERNVPPAAEVWIDWQHLKLKLTSLGDYVLPGAVLLKDRGRLRITIQVEKDGVREAHNGHYVKRDEIKAVVLEPDVFTIQTVLQQLHPYSPCRLG